MAKRVLVAYGTKYGATAEIAEKVGDILKEEGHEVDVLSADRAGDLEEYDAYIIGSAIYIDKWRKEVNNLITENEQIISGKPVWFFSSGPIGEGDPVELADGFRYPKKLHSVFDRIQPRDTAVFHGVADVSKYGLTEKLVLKVIRAKPGDYRDWDTISAWAKNIADTLKSE